MCGPIPELTHGGRNGSRLFIFHLGDVTQAGMGRHSQAVELRGLGDTERDLVLDLGRRVVASASGSCQMKIPGYVLDRARSLGKCRCRVGLVLVRAPMRFWILKVHLYGGLLCSAYLMVFGFSSLNFNHHFAFAKPLESKESWEAPLDLPLDSDNLKAAESVRDELGLMGWPLPWTMNRDSEGNLHFNLERPGKSYTLDVLVKEKRAKVQERRKGFWPVLNSLHALMSVPNAPFTRMWGWFTEFCTWVVLFSATSGLYLWACSRRERWTGLWLFSGATAAALALILYVVVQG